MSPFRIVVFPGDYSGPEVRRRWPDAERFSSVLGHYGSSQGALALLLYPDGTGNPPSSPVPTRHYKPSRNIDRVSSFNLRTTSLVVYVQHHIYIGILH